MTRATLPPALDPLPATPPPAFVSAARYNPGLLTNADRQSPPPPAFVSRTPPQPQVAHKRCGGGAVRRDGSGGAVGGEGEVAQLAQGH